MGKRMSIPRLVLYGTFLVSLIVLPGCSIVATRETNDRLRANKALQHTITRLVAEALSQQQTYRLLLLNNLGSTIQLASGGDLPGEHLDIPPVRESLERLVSDSDDIVFATVVNSERRGVTAGSIEVDDFVRREIEHAFNAAHEGQSYNGPATRIGTGLHSRLVTFAGSPVRLDGRFVGFIGVVVDQESLVYRLRESSLDGLKVYVVDNGGRLMVSPDPGYEIGEDMTKFDIVRAFVNRGQRKIGGTAEFSNPADNGKTKMLGTYEPVASLTWAVIAQRVSGE
jgi:hypothetical protein